LAANAEDAEEKSAAGKILQGSKNEKHCSENYKHMYWNMKTKITVICENRVNTSSGLIAEHGLSFLIENEDTTLFDTGQGLGLINNLRSMKKNIGDIRRIILSHGHYDHTGGLSAILKIRSTRIPVFAHSDVFIDKYAQINENGKLLEKFIGIQKERTDYEKLGAKFRFIKGYTPITENISAITEIKRPHDWKSWDSRLKQKTAGSGIIDDPFLDDLSLLIKTDSGPVVLLGCAHAGVVEILHDLSVKTGYKEFYAVIGGTHLGNAPKEYINKAVETLKNYKIKIIAPCHCTGFNIECLFSNEFQNSFRSAEAGAIFEF
jgi:7,8-dihydropterin-6-yl-methyl-4-(beta-D-ribofuranosyl)aminobenzene 5'-phosphate synthase